MCIFLQQVWVCGGGGWEKRDRGLETESECDRESERKRNRDRDRKTKRERKRVSKIAHWNVLVKLFPGKNCFLNYLNSLNEWNIWNGNFTWLREILKPNTWSIQNCFFNCLSTFCVFFHKLIFYGCVGLVEKWHQQDKGIC